MTKLISTRLEMDKMTLQEKDDEDNISFSSSVGTGISLSRSAFEEEGNVVVEKKFEEELDQSLEDLMEKR